MADTRRVAVVTGASSGIGLAVARSLAEQGWRVIMQGRDAARSAAAETAVREAAAAGGDAEMIRVDLSLLREASRLADAILARTDRVDALILNAGGLVPEERISDEGLEETLVANHLGHFLLARRLQPLLETAVRVRGPRSARIVTVSSRAHPHPGTIEWDNLNRAGRWDRMGAYAQAKLFNILHARELARRLAPQGIVAHAMHPGIVDTNFVAYGGAQLREHFARATLASPSDAAATLVWLAASAEAGETSGGYWFDMAPEDSSELSQDREAAARLWQESERLIAARVTAPA